jgi:methyltransferase
VSLLAFTTLVCLVALQRLAEVRRSRHNQDALVARGGQEHARWQVKMLAVVHTTWLVAMLIEAWWLRPPFHAGLAATALGTFVGGQLLRLAAISALGPRWTIAIVTLPDAPRITSGAYRYLRHPNYVGVVIEIASLPLIHGAFRTAIVWSVLNLIALAVRIRAEEAALNRARRGLG